MNTALEIVQEYKREAALRTSLYKRQEDRLRSQYFEDIKRIHVSMERANRGLGA